jgi:hypothetical protein
VHHHTWPCNFLKKVNIKLSPLQEIWTHMFTGTYS